MCHEDYKYYTYVSRRLKILYICVTKIKNIIHNVHLYSTLYANALRPVICEGWHFTHVKNHLHHFTKRGCLSQKN